MEMPIRGEYAINTTKGYTVAAVGCKEIGEKNLTDATWLITAGRLSKSEMDDKSSPRGCDESSHTQIS
jgi:hypothetical protein